MRNLERLRTGGSGSKMTVGVPPPRTPSGRVYRYSPKEDAHPRHFLLGEVNAKFTIVDAARSRMKLEPRSPQTVCPYSGYVGLDAEFNHPDDMKAAVELVKHAAMSDVEEMLASAFKGLNNRSSRNSLVRIEAKVSSRPRPKPRFSRRDLLREMECDHCGRDYGVYAIALFCPDCGAPNLRLHFSRECKLVGEQVELADTLSSDRQELAYRLLGNAHEDVLTAFEATLKVAYHYALSQRPEIKAKPVKNEFQNVDFGRDRFSAFDFDPYDNLSADELAVLRLNIQKRHIIGHNLGVVDAKFAKQATDAKIGETVHLIGQDIIQFASIGQKVIDRLDEWIGGTTSPKPLNPPAPVPDGPAADKKDNQQMSDTEIDIDVSSLAKKIGTWIATTSEFGLPDPIGGNDIEQAFAGEEARLVEEALAELEAEGLLTSTALMNAKFPRVRPTLDLFAVFDPVVVGFTPFIDAGELIDLILDGTMDSVRLSDLHEKTGWAIRRFNPAVSYVISLIEDGRVSGETGSHPYPVRYFSVAAPDRVEMRAFLKRTRGS
ncbi:hypothetical protein [Sinorhizobium fredii]|nr:hypothetical protein [Sinorhizobium fredii]